jgi:hypothetical protein
MVWIALAVIALMGVAGLLAESDHQRLLRDASQEHLVVTRLPPGTHIFPAIGIKITPPPGWICLSVAGQEDASQATFVNASEHSIVRILAIAPPGWPEDAEVSRQQWGDVTVQWLTRTRRRLVLSMNPPDVQPKHQWIEFDPRSIGRLVHGDSQRTIVAVTHTYKSSTNRAVESLCAAVEFLGGSK